MHSGVTVVFGSFIVALLLGLGLCSVCWAQGSAQFDGQYVGELTLTKVIGGDCTRPPPGALYPLTIAGGEVRFLYTPRFATTLSGTVAKNGDFLASATTKTGFVQMIGHVRGNRLTADILSPSCNYRFQTSN